MYAVNLRLWTNFNFLNRKFNFLIISTYDRYTTYYAIDFVIKENDRSEILNKCLKLLFNNSELR